MRKRRQGESFEAYRKARKQEQLTLEAHLKGRMYWNSMELGVLVLSADTITRHKNEREARARLDKYISKRRAVA